ncbi:MAG TPA: alpha/beta fold hydrolase [Candidatus Methanoperedens sp.]|nr:alpha/beta fold hydrolase [Candidatus Methanoperedens sp.]
MPERPFFFPGGNHTIFGVLYDAGHRPAQRGYVFCAPFAEEMLWSQRVFVSLARELCSRGFPVLRFDYAGTGDSEGDFQDSTMQGWLSDIGAAIDVLREECQVQSVVLLGLGLGATLAARKAEEEALVRGLVLWQPVLSGPSYMKEILRTNITTQLAIWKEVRHKSEDLVRFLAEGSTVNFDGYELSHALYEEISEVNLLDKPKTFSGRVLLVQVSRKPEQPNRQMQHLQSLYAKCELAVACEQFFWKEIKIYYERAEDLFRLTLGWMGNE